MLNMDEKELTELRIDVLTEISNIGTGKAVRSISSMLNGNIDIEVPDIRLLKFSELAEAVGGAERAMVGILVNLQKELSGMVMFLIDYDSAMALIGDLMGNTEKKQCEGFSEMELSAVTELGNIIAGSYLSAISSFTGLNAATSVPELSVDMAGAILSVPATEYGKVSDSVLMIQSDIKSERFNVTGNFILAPTVESFDKMVEALWE